MCGRYSLTSDRKKLAQRFGADASGLELRPRYNLAPSDEAPVIVKGEEKLVRMMRWGLVPSWAKDPSVGCKMINARAETLAERASFRKPLERSRCLVPADGFYEWPKREKGQARRPLRIVLKEGGMFGFAGLWDRWKKADGGILESFTIVTTQANELILPIHDRMPVVLRKEDEEFWLDPSVKDVGCLQSLLLPYDSYALKMYDVSPAVNSPRNDLDRIEPIHEEKS
jgi:putative SOS response-associated peptidase YedK